MSTTATEPETKRAAPAWRRLLAAAGWFALFCVLVSAAVYLFNRHRLTSELDRVMAELDESDPGWRWDGILATRGEVKEEENCAQRVLAIARDMPRSWPDFRKYELVWNLPPNAALDEPRQKVLDELMAVHPIPRLRAEARDLVRFPRGRLELVVPENPFALSTDPHHRLRAPTQVLMLDARALALAGRHGEAMKAAHACLYISRVLEDEPHLIGQLIRVAVATISTGTAERVLALGEVPDTSLAAYQADLAREAAGMRLTAGLRGERASIHQVFGLIARGKLTLRDIGGSSAPPAWWGLAWLQAFANQEIARREHADALRLMTRMVEASRLPLKDQFAAEAALESDLAALSGASVIRQLAPAMQKASNAGRRAHCQAIAMRALIAVERYRLRHGKWPAKLEDTVPAFLEKVPLDPIDEKPIRYKRWADGVVVYSIGNDRTDDGGDVPAPYKDVGYRLWDKDKRRVAPPPLPPDAP